VPELPEVETVVRALRPSVAGRRVLAVRLNWARHVAAPAPAEFQAQMAGRTIRGLGRRGKYLVFSLDDGRYLLAHLKMSGQFILAAADAPPDPHAHTVFTLDDGRELRFRDTRKFGRLYLVDEAETVVGGLGLEPLSDDFSERWLAAYLAGRRRTLKPLLLDQTFLAGLGNIYADEALHRAGLHPRRRSDTLSAAEVQALRSGIVAALESGLAGHGATISTFRRPDGARGEAQERFLVYGREGRPCTRCRAPIQRVVLGGRSTYFCPVCQPETE
jgi:formamidopyrimidine-DNA glycosylase